MPALTPDAEAPVPGRASQTDASARSSSRGAEPSAWGPGDPARPSLRYIFLRFLRHGLLAWGGPVAQIGLMHRELVQRDRWIDETRFRKTLALYQALPGPEAHELAVYFGHLKRGRWGGFLAGLAFMLPGVVLVTILAALYVRYATAAAFAEVILYGVRPAVIALVAFAFLRLARANLRGPALLAIGIAAAASGQLLRDVNVLLILALGGLVALSIEFATGRLEPPIRGGAHAFFPLGLAIALPAIQVTGLVALSLLSLKVGLLTFGGAYTAIPFLQQGAVEAHGWITNAQFLDALALTGMVPGPLIAVGTFVGYMAAGPTGALVATVIIFAPAFAFTLLGHDHFERMIREPRFHAFLVGVSAAVVGLILTSSLPLARAAIVDVPTGTLAVAAYAGLATGRIPIPVVLLLSACGGAVWRLAT